MRVLPPIINELKGKPRRLVEYPLTADDWAAVHTAWLAFLVQCQFIAARAAARSVLASEERPE